MGGNIKNGPRVVNLLFQAFFVYFRVVYSIFPHTFSEKGHLCQDRREAMCHFRLGYEVFFATCPKKLFYRKVARIKNHVTKLFQVNYILKKIDDKNTVLKIIRVRILDINIVSANKF